MTGRCSWSTWPPSMLRPPAWCTWLRSPLELRAVATINSELSPLGTATVAALYAEPTHTFQIPAGSVAAGAADVHRRAGVYPKQTVSAVVNPVRLGSRSTY